MKSKVCFAFLVVPWMWLVSGAWAEGPASTRPEAISPLRLSIRGTQLVAPDGREIHLRGFNLLWWVPPTEQDVRDIKAMGANCVRYQFGYIPRGRFDPEQISRLKRHVRLFTSQGLWVIPNVHTFQSADRPGARNVWNSPEMLREFFEMWDYILEELKDEPFIAAWEPINEPHFVERARLRPWYEEVVAHFRERDPRTPVVVEGADYSGAEELLDELKLDDPNVIYSFHFYYPHEYTHMRRPEGEPPLAYPGKFDRTALERRMSTAIQFRDRHRVPVWCGEWGVQTGALGYGQWLRDVSDLLEENHLPWTHWAWALQRRYPVNDTFDCNPQKREIFQIMKAVFERSVEHSQQRR